MCVCVVFSQYSAYDFECVRATRMRMCLRICEHKRAAVFRVRATKNVQNSTCMCVCVCIHARISTRMQTGLAKLGAIVHFNGVARLKCMIKIPAKAVLESQGGRASAIAEQEHIIMLMKMRSEWRTSRLG